MRIASIEGQGIPGLPDGSWSFTGPAGAPASVIAVTGRSGCGKTSLLEAIVAFKETVAPYGVPLGHRRLHEPTGEVRRLRVEWALERAESERAGIAGERSAAELRFDERGGVVPRIDPGLRAALTAYSHDPSVPKLDFLEAERDLPRLPLAVGDDIVSEQRSRRLCPGNDKYAGVLRMLRASLIGQYEPARAERARELFAELAPGRRITTIGRTGELSVETSRGATVPARHLSKSERQALILVGSVVFVGLDNSIVLVDTPELGLGHGEAARWLSALRNHAPAAQWVFATLDETLIAAAEAVVRLDTP